MKQEELADNTCWKALIVEALAARDQTQRICFNDVFNDYGSLNSRICGLITENTRLARDCHSLRQDNMDMKIKLEKANALKSYDYEQKVFLLQEEVTELHRQKGVLAENVIGLTKTAQEKDKDVQSLNAKLSESEVLINDLKIKSQQLCEKVKELEGIKKLFTEEQASNLVSMKALEAKCRQLEDDNVQLMRRLKVLQGTVEKLKNIEYDVQYRKTRETIRKNLHEAANAVIEFPDSGLSEMPLPFRSTVPQRAICKIDANDGEVNSVRFSPSGHLFGSAGYDRKVRLWTVVNGKCDLHATLVGCNASVTAIDFDRNETAVLGASSDFSCRVWTLNDSRLRVNLTGHSERVVSAKFMDSAKQVVTASSDRTMKLWDAEKCRCKRTIMAPSIFQDVVVCPPLSALITGHYDHNIRIWDERTGENTSQIQLSGRITGLDISTDRTTVLASTRNNTLEIINLRMNQVCQCLSSDGFCVGLDIVRPCFSPDTEYAAVGGQDGGLYIWNIATGQLEVCLKEHNTVVVCCHWNPVGHSLVSCERVKQAIVWSNI